MCVQHIDANQINTYLLCNYISVCFCATKNQAFKVTVEFERCFRLMEHISVILSRNLVNLYITEKLIKFSKSLFYFSLVISNK